LTGSGCFEDQWNGLSVNGSLALVKRGTCSISDKLKIAKNRGALGVILFHNTNSTPNAATLSAENVGLLAPVGLVSLSVGEAWYARIARNETLNVSLLVDSVFERRSSWNVFAETREGDPNNVIMLGAHLDSVQAGPGINDDGSGVTAQIEIIRALRSFRGIKNKIRFAFWGAEEPGLIGSLYYTAHLSSSEVEKIRFYFNYDMIGSPEPVYGIYASDNAADKVGAQILLDYLVQNGKPAYFGSFGTGSDYVGFLNLGIPSSGIHTGGGVPTDPCYHLACDTYDNINWEALELNTKAAAKAAASLALSLEGLPSGNATSLNPRNKVSIRTLFDKWEQIKLEVAGGHSCALQRERKT
jgi:aminopeptidase Y